MKIEYLKKKRQKNVQEQNALSQHNIEKLALSYINNPDDFKWLSTILSQHGLNPKKGILAELAFCLDQGLVEDCSGIWLTTDKRFFKFEVKLEYPTYKFLTLEGWIEVTHEIEVSRHGHGIGKTFGFLAIDAMEKIKIKR